MSGTTPSGSGAARALHPSDPHADRKEPASASYWAQVRHLVLHGLPAFMVLVALTIVVEHQHLIPRADAFFAGFVTRKNVIDSSGDAVVDPTVTVVEISAPLRLKRFEAMEGMEDDTAERMDGVRPTDRKRVAGYLRDMAALIGPLDEKTSSLKVIGVDVDLAPLEGNGAAGGSNEILAALNQLRAIAPVVIVAFQRPVGQREARNVFMRKSGCESASTAEATHPKLNPLYFATPAIFTARNEVPLRYPEELKEGAAKTSPSSDALPHAPVFPSLGGLMHVVADGDPDEEARRSLRFICQQARVAGFDDAILQDRFGDAGQDPKVVAEVRRSYEERMYNWRLLDRSRVELRVVNRVEELSDGPNDDDFQRKKLEQLREQIVGGKGLILSIASGGTNDRYYVPYAYRDWVSGATVHAMEMVSRTEGVDEESPLALGFDLLVGVVFIGVASLAIPFFERVIEVVPTLGGVVLSVLPLLIATPLVFASVLFCSGQLDGVPSRWCNPFFVIIGLAIHAYLEGRGGNAHGEHGQSIVSSLSFRIDRARAAWHERNAHRGVRGKARLADGLAPAVLCWTLWLVALWFLAVEHATVLKGGAFVALLVTLGAAFIALRQPLHRETS